MARTYNVIDADGHILEPFELWQEYTDPKYRDRAPRLVEEGEGKRRLIIEDRALGDPNRSFGSIGGIGARQGTVVATEMKYEEGRAGGVDPPKRIPRKGPGGLHPPLLYPNGGAFAGAGNEPPPSPPPFPAPNPPLAPF